MEILNKYAQYNILLVDDDLEICELITEYVERADFVRSMVIAHDGMSAAAKLRNQKFDLILLDMKMPKRTGYDLLGDFEQDKLNLNSVDKILAMSGSMDKDIFTIATYHGVKNFLIKPFDEAIFMQKISKIIPIKVP